MSTAPVEVMPQVPQIVYISFSAEITPSSTEWLISTCAGCANKRVSEIYLLFSTPGGSVMHGITLFNTLRALPIKLTTHNVGNVDSIGNVVFLAGSTRYACAHSTFMFHGVGSAVGGNTRLEEKFLRERLNAIKADQARIGQIIVQCTSIGQQEVDSLFLETQTKDAVFAKSKGIVNEIRDAALPPGCTILSPVFR